MKLVYLPTYGAFATLGNEEQEKLSKFDCASRRQDPTPHQRSPSSAFHSYHPSADGNKHDFKMRVEPEVIDNSEKFQVTMDIPGVEPDNVSVTLEDSEKALVVRGYRQYNQGYTANFHKKFSLDPTVDVDRISADLQHGVLVVSAPKDAKRLETRVRSIPVAVANEKKEQPKESVLQDAKSEKQDEPKENAVVEGQQTESKERDEFLVVETAKEAAR